MSRIILAGVIIWSVVFYFRIIQINGLDPTYQEKGNQSFQPLQKNFSQIFGQTLPYPQSALMSGILLGEQNSLPFSLKNDLKATSTIHIVVVSGQNLTILAGCFLNFAGWIGRRKALVLTFLAIISYSLLTGLQIPVMRAAVMASLVYLAQLLGKEGAGPWVLLLTAAGMLIFNPNWVLNISFQLSFLATFGVIVVAPILVKAFKFVPKLLREDLAVTMAAQAMVTPVIAYNFNQMSLISLLVNGLVLWTIPIVMVAGGAVLLAGGLNLFLGQIIGLIPGILLTYFIYLVQFFAKLPGAGITLGTTTPVLWVGFYLIIWAIVWGMHRHQNLNNKSTEVYDMINKW